MTMSVIPRACRKKEKKKRLNTESQAKPNLTSSFCIVPSLSLPSFPHIPIDVDL
jgi:hypothetical protein